MDVYYVFSSSAAQRDSSRLDTDLKSIRRCSLTAAERPPAKRSPWPSNRQPHVGIVGAGIAGLRCADVLLQRGFRVTVLEGRHRLGGRLHQARLVGATAAAAADGDGGPLVDMGPNWIHGTKDNPVLDLVRATGTVASSYDVDEQGNDLAGAVFGSDGSLLPLDEGEAASTAMWKIVEEAFVHSNQHCSTIDAGDSLSGFFRARVKAHVPRDAAPEDAAAALRRKELVLQMADSWGAFVGSPASRQSLKFFWLEECIEGGTYKNVLDRLSEPVVQGAAIHYGQRVDRIVTSHCEDGSAAGVEDAGVRVATSCGDAFLFDEVVCTAPLGWLQKHAAAAFEPPLPGRVRRAIESIGYGCLEKVYISFPEAFWQRPDPATGRVVRGFCQWLAPGVYAQPTNPQHWLQEAVDLAALPKSAAHPTLLFYIFGQQSEHVMGTLAALRDEHGAAAAAGGVGEFSETHRPNAQQASFLFEHFRPYFSTLPNYDAASPACQPTACIASNWLHDDLAGNGSYSNFQVGLTAGDEDIRVMREGLPERGLWLAGEHTAPFVALGTATGAYWSGESVGRRIAEMYGRERVSVGGQGVGVVPHVPETSMREPVEARS